MAAIKLFKMYAMDIPCERDIFKTVSPIDFKFHLKCHIILRTDAIDFGPSAQIKMAAIKEIYVLSKVIYACECDISKAVSPISFKLEICFPYYLENRRFDFRPSVKNKIAAIELLKMFAMDNPCESGIFRTISPIHFKLEFCFDII